MDTKNISVVTLQTREIKGVHKLQLHLHSLLADTFIQSDQQEEDYGHGSTGAETNLEYVTVSLIFRD